MEFCRTIPEPLRRTWQLASGTRRQRHPDFLSDVVELPPTGASTWRATDEPLRRLSLVRQPLCRAPRPSRRIAGFPPECQGALEPRGREKQRTATVRQARAGRKYVDADANRHACNIWEVVSRIAKRL